LIVKIVIIGAGAAGLAMAISLERMGIDYSVHERTGHLGQEGLGFILRQNGLDSLQQIEARLVPEVVQTGAWLNHFTLRNPDGSTILDQPLHHALGIRRADLIGCLMKHVNPARVHMHSQCVGFERDAKGHAVAALFDDGRREEGDLFLACDGSRSRTRALLFPQAYLEPVVTHELVSIVHHAELAQEMAGHFIKTQDNAGSLALGLVPCGGDRIIWYMQFDQRHTLAHDSTEMQRRNFAFKLVQEWADPIPRLLHASDWQGTHVWRTTDMNPLPALHRDNVVLMGDAGHPMLTFTSQGVNTALDDAFHLSQMIAKRGLPLDADLDEWSAARLAELAPMLEGGRKLQQDFLHYDPNRPNTVPLVD
jgi:2-polyprenyl-6-methoxyphenol hydroxylase-like FAD-dependent oxidoreductase